MHIRKFLRAAKWTIKDLAHKVGCTHMHLGNVSRLKQLPSLKLAKRLEAASNGIITADELMFPERYIIPIEPLPRGRVKKPKSAILSK